MRINTGLSEEWFSPLNTETDARFKLKPLDNLTMADIISDGSMKGGNFSLSKAGRRLLLAQGLVGWEGITDENDAPVEFTQKHFKSIPYPILLEIAMKLIEISSVSEEDRKN
jgi:hypothetical protein